VPNFQTIGQTLMGQKFVVGGWWWWVVVVCKHILVFSLDVGQAEQ
jgi:hypothetical protein